VPIKGVAFENAATPQEQMAAKMTAEDNESMIEQADDDDNATIGDDDNIAQQMRLDAASGNTTKAEAASSDPNDVNTAGSPAYTTGHAKNTVSNASFVTNATAETGNTISTPTGNEGIEMPREQILSFQSGILVFNIISGNLARKGARLEVAFDDAYWPNYSTEVARTTHQTWDEVGETFIRELGYSRIVLRLNEAEKESREDVQAEFRTSLNEFLEECLVSRVKIDKLASQAECNCALRTSLPSSHSPTRLVVIAAL
jgi:hypothetical protein